MLRTAVRIFIAAAVAASLAAPLAVAAKSLRNAPLNPKLIELRGEVVAVDRPTGKDWGATITL